MPLILTSPPTVEPVTLAEAKAHLRIEHTDEDALIASLVLAARLHVERLLAIAMLNQGWSLLLDRWPSDAVTIPLYPVASLTAVTVRDADGLPAVVPAADYSLDKASRMARLDRSSATVVWPPPGPPMNGIEISFQAGFGDTAMQVPEPLRQAVVRLAADWYEARSTVEVGSAEQPLPAAVAALVAPYRVRRLR